MVDTVQKVQIDYVSTGADKAAADLDRVAAAETRVNALEQQATVVKETLTRSQLNVTTQLDRYVRSLDPVSKALADVERGERLVRTARAQGLDVAASAERALENARKKYDDLTRSINDNAAAQARRNAISQRIDVITGVSGGAQRSAADIADYGRQLDDLRAKFNPVFAAGRQYRDTLNEISQAAKTGAISERERLAALERTKAAFANQVNTIRNVGGSGINDGGMTARTQMLMLQSSLSNTASSLGSGASLSQVVMQQAPDLLQAFGGGGLGGALKSVKDSLVSMVTPARVLGVTLAGAGLAAASSFWRAHEAQLALSGSMIGIGRGTGLTMGGLNAAAAQGAAASGGYLSISSAREATAAIASTGVVDRSIIGGTVGNVERYAKITGQEIPDATKSLAAAFADPVKGAVDLDKSLGFLNDKLAQTIKNLSDSGDAAGAQKALFDAWKQSVDSAAEAVDKNRGAFSRLWSGIKTGVSNADTWLGDRMNGSSAQDQIATLRQELDQAKSGIYSKSVSARVLSENPGRIAELERSLQAEQSKAEANKKEVADNRLSMLGGATVRKYASEQTDLKSLVDARDAVSKLIGDADALAKTGVSAEQAATAFQRLNTAITNYESPVQKVITDSALATRQTEAYTFAERAAVAEEQARVSALRSSKDSLVAAAEAEKARNQLIAEGNAKANQYARDVSDNSKLVGLTGFARREQERQNALTNFKTQYTSSSETPVISGFQRVGSSAETLANTLTAAAAKISGGAAAGGASLPTFASGNMAAYAAAIAKIESGGNYGAIGPETKSGDHGYGKYQVMGANIPSWTKMASGQALTPSQFLANPSIQEAVFSQQFGSSVAKYGSAQDAASVWLTGKPLARAGNARDVNGTSGADYVAKFNAALNGTTPEKLAQIKSTGAEVYGKSTDAARQNDINESVISPFKSAEQSIADMNRQTDLMRQTFGKSQAEIDAATEAEKLRTTYIHDGLYSSKAAASAIGLMNDKIDATRTASLQASQAKQAEAERQSKISGNYDLVRSSTSDMISSPLKAIVRGQNVGTSMKDAGLRMVDKVVDMGTNSITDSLFGKSGTFGGLFGGSLSSLFGAGSSTAANTTTNAAMATINASSVNVVGGASIGSLSTGTGTSAASSSFGSIGEWFKNLFADGGVMSSSGPIPLRRYAAGGVANSAQMAIFGEGSMNEAYVPLADGRSIPVTMRGGGSQAINISHTVNNHVQGAEVQTKATRQSNGHVQLETLVTGIIQSHVSKNGTIAKTFQNTYGLSRATGKA